MDPTILVLAAGMGSRYGGLKQIDPVGPNGEFIIDYSVFDAIRAGFKKVVFVIRKDIEADFREAVGSRYENRIEVSYAFQELNALPAGFTCPVSRLKPWGTAHAILSAKDNIPGPFGVINADDFYGADGFQQLASFFQSSNADSKLALVAYVLRNTLSDFGSVARGICSADEKGNLRDVTEFTSIERDGDGAVNLDANGIKTSFTGEEPVSMNMWGFTSLFMTQAEELFAAFLTEHMDEEKAEFYIPTVIDHMIRTSSASVQVLQSLSSWFGVTYPEDRPHVVSSIAKLVESGAYPARLWESV